MGNGNKGNSDGQTLTLEYDLPSLPTAQHKAGLAGLLLVVDAMKELNRQTPPGIEEVEHPSLQAKIALTPASYQSLMNELYGGCLVEAWSKQPRKDENKQAIPPLRSENKVEVDKKTGKSKNVTYYVYEDVAPEGPFFKARIFGNFSDKKGFLKLWRDAIWGTVRGVPTTRNPYKERQQGKDAAGSGVSELWSQLVKADKKKDRPITMPVASSIWLGAQDHNAEYVAFQGSPKDTLLLHFWNVVMQVFVPQVVERDSKTGEAKVATAEGYILALPEVSNLVEFKQQFAESMANLIDDGKSFRPLDSQVCLPQEGALQLLSRLGARAQARATRRQWYSVSAIEVFHLHKPGNTVMTLASDRILVDDEKLTDYERIHRKTHPLLRAHLIRNLLCGQPWYRGFNRLAADTAAEWLVGQAGGSFSTGWFCAGVRGQFESDAEIINQEGAII